jgi:hypothetical protein
MKIVTRHKGIEYNHADYTTEEQLATLPDVVRAIIENKQ